MNQASNAEQIENVAVLTDEDVVLVAVLDESELVAILGDLK